MMCTLEHKRRLPDHTVMEAGPRSILLKSRFSISKSGLAMHNRSRRGNGRLKKDHLKSQREYADAIGVTAGYVSKRTKNDGRLIDGRFDPFKDAQFEDGDPENGDLLGYTDPTDRTATNGEGSTANAQKGARNRSRGESGRARKNPSARGGGSKPPASRERPEGSDGLEQAIDRAGEKLGQEAARRPEAFHAVLRVGSAALGGILGVELVGRGAVPALVGAAIGAGLVEVSLRSSPNRPQQPTRQIRGLSLPAASVPAANLPGGRAVLPPDFSEVSGHASNRRKAQ